jgi:hypothetical protein
MTSTNVYQSHTSLPTKLSVPVQTPNKEKNKEKSKLDSKLHSNRPQARGTSPIITAARKSTHSTSSFPRRNRHHIEPQNACKTMQSSASLKLLENLAARCKSPGSWLVVGVCRTWCGMPCYTAETSKPCRDPGCRKIARDRLRFHDARRWLQSCGSLVSSERALGEATRIGV